MHRRALLCKIPNLCVLQVNQIFFKYQIILNLDFDTWNLKSMPKAVCIPEMLLYNIRLLKA